MNPTVPFNSEDQPPPFLPLFSIFPKLDLVWVRITGDLNLNIYSILGHFHFI